MDFPPSSSSSSPPFSFSSPSSSAFHQGLSSSPPPPSHFLPPHSSLPYFDSSPFQLPRRSPRLSSRLVSSFSPSPSLLTRSLSPHKRHRDSTASAFFDPSPSFDEGWTNVFPPTQTSQSSRSTPQTSREGGGRREERGGGSERLGERSLVDGEERYRLIGEEEDREEPSPAAHAHAKFIRMQQQLLRAASGEEFVAAKKVKREREEEGEASASSTPFTLTSTLSGFTETAFPSSSTSSTSSSTSYPSLSSLSSAFSSPAPNPADAPTGLPVPLSLTDSGRTSPSSPTFRPGESCHQCKTRRLVPDLIFCSARHLKKGRARKKKKERQCRKKYCARCLAKFYGEGVPDPNLPWVCPGCRGVCSCAACKRHATKREQRERKLKLKGGKKRKGQHVEKASAAKMVKAAGLTSGTAIAAPVASVTAGAGKAIPVSLSIPIDGSSLTPSLAITVEPSNPSRDSSAVKREHTRRSPRIQQRELSGHHDVIALGPMQASVHPSMSSPSGPPPFHSSPSSPTAFTFSPHHVDTSSSSPPPFNANPMFSPSPYHSSSLLLSSPSPHYMGGYPTFSSPMMPSSSLSFSPMGGARRSPRLAGRLLSDHSGGGGGGEMNWRQHFAF